MRKITFFITVLLSGLFLYACMDEPEEKLVPVKLSLNPEEIQTEFELGRVLFYDKNLSINNSVSCASCHKQAFAFADNVAFSAGFENRRTTRNSMPIQNLGGAGFDGFDFQPVAPLFWDGREQNIFEMVLKPIVNHREMGISDLEEFTKKLSGIDYYKTAFNNLYGEKKVTLDRVSQALGVFVMNITSHNTRFDQMLSEGEGLNPLESAGMELFFGKYDCNACHQVQNPSGYLLVGGGFSNIGLDPVYEDTGLEQVSGKADDSGKFKIPSLRNVALTAPYMHDGRFQTLEEVIDHYSTGLTTNPNLDPRLRDAEGRPLDMQVSEQEKQAIIAFLHTLTDYSMISDPDFSDPFNRP